MTHHLRTRHSGEKKKNETHPIHGKYPQESSTFKGVYICTISQGAAGFFQPDTQTALRIANVLPLGHSLLSFMLFALQVVLPQIMSTILFSECISECFLTSKGSCVQMVHCGKEHCCTLMHEDETEIWETHSLLLSYYIYLQHRKSNWHKQRS